MTTFSVRKYTQIRYIFDIQCITMIFMINHKIIFKIIHNHNIYPWRGNVFYTQNLIGLANTVQPLRRVGPLALTAPNVINSCLDGLNACGLVNLQKTPKQNPPRDLYYKINALSIFSMWFSNTLFRTYRFYKKYKKYTHNLTCFRNVFIKSTYFTSVFNQYSVRIFFTLTCFRNVFTNLFLIPNHTLHTPYSFIYIYYPYEYHQ